MSLRRRGKSANERYYIENMECVNKVKPTRTFKEYYEENRDKLLEYIIKNVMRITKIN
jgi:hypothetical protein